MSVCFISNRYFSSARTDKGDTRREFTVRSHRHAGRTGAGVTEHSEEQASSSALLLAGDWGQLRVL